MGNRRKGLRAQKKKIISTKKSKGGNPQYVKLMTEVNLISLSSKLFRDKRRKHFQGKNLNTQTERTNSFRIKWGEFLRKE